MNPTPVQTGNRNKARGLNAERRVRDHLTADGYWVVKVAGSLGPADLLALKPGQTLLVQVKTESRTGRKAHIPPDEWNTLLTAAQQVGGTPIIAIKGFRRLDYHQIIGPKTAPTRTPPWRPWAADQVIA